MFASLFTPLLNLLATAYLQELLGLVSIFYIGVVLEVIVLFFLLTSFTEKLDYENLLQMGALVTKQVK